MDGISVLDPAAWSTTELKNNEKYLIGNALGWLSRSEKQASVNSLLSGRLYLAKSGWLLLSVPNAFVRGVFDALTAPGAELPTAGLMNVPNVDGDVLNAHISVMTADEVKSVGADKINERGHLFHYGLGGVKEIPVKNVEGVSKVWVVQVQSPALAALRKSYGLSPLPNGDHPFHITVAARRKHVLSNNEVSKFDNAPSRGELKAAAAYNFVGRVQGVNLRKTLHKILDDLDRPGLAYNNARTGEARAIIPGNKKTQQEVLDLLQFHLAQRSGRKQLTPGVDYDIKPLPKQKERLHNVVFTPKDLQKFIVRQGFNRLAAENPDYQQQWINERYRLQPDNAGNLVGAVPALAKKQLFHGEPVYEYQLVPGWQDKKGVDMLPGGKSDNMPDSAFPKKELTEGVKHEREHTDNDQVAKEIAKDHLQERTDYYEKIEEIENEAKKAKDNSPIIKQLREAKQHSDSKRYGHKTEILRRLMTQSPQDWRVDDDSQKYHGVTHGPTNFRFHVHPAAIDDRVQKSEQKAAYYTPNHPYKSVYVQEALNQFNRRIPITYDHNLPLFKNIQNQLAEIKQRGDFILRTRQNAERYRAHFDPMYRQQIALDALYNKGPQVPMLDRIINLHGNGVLASLGGAK